MKAMSKIDAIGKHFIYRTIDDYEGLWVLADLVGDELDIEDAQQVREMTMGILADLLTHEWVRIGTLSGRDGRFKPWSMDVVEALEYIATEWEKLGRLPTIGEIAWFDITKKGERHVSHYLQEEPVLKVEQVK